ncbi:MAG: glutaredoxin family protein [Actinomycetota bacterium]
MEIIIVTQPACAFCDQAREILERLSNRYGFTVRTVDLATPEGQDLGERGAMMFPPGILIDGQLFSYGRLSERRLRRELEKRPQREARR